MPNLRLAKTKPIELHATQHGRRDFGKFPLATKWYVVVHMLCTIRHGQPGRDLRVVAGFGVEMVNDECVNFLWRWVGPAAGTGQPKRTVRPMSHNWGRIAFMAGNASPMSGHGGALLSKLGGV
jgi:hypothetical protein